MNGLIYYESEQKRVVNGTIAKTRKDIELRYNTDGLIFLGQSNYVIDSMKWFTYESQKGLRSIYCTNSDNHFVEKGDYIRNGENALLLSTFAKERY